MANILWNETYRLRASRGCILINGGELRLEELDFHQERLLIVSGGTVALSSGLEDHVVTVHLEVWDVPTLHPWPDLAQGDDGTVGQDQAEVRYETTARLSMRFLDLLDGAPFPEYQPFPVPSHELLLEAKAFTKHPHEWDVEDLDESDVQRWTLRLSPLGAN